MVKLAIILHNEKVNNGEYNMGGMVYAVYIDDGPNGVCGQTVDITRNELHIFNTYEEFKCFALRVEKINSRKKTKDRRFVG